MTEPQPHAPAANVADSLVAFVKRCGIPVDEDSAITDLLAAVEPRPLLPHGLLLIAGTVLAAAFRYDRSMAEPASADADNRLNADRSF